MGCYIAYIVLHMSLYRLQLVDDMLLSMVCDVLLDVAVNVCLGAIRWPICVLHCALYALHVVLVVCLSAAHHACITAAMSAAIRC